MGRPKITLGYGSGTMIGTVVRRLLDANPDEVVVVTLGELAAKLDLPTDRRVRIAINDDPESEMIDSVRVGLAALTCRNAQVGCNPHRSETPDQRGSAARDRRLREADMGILVVPADMPAIAVDTYRQCMEVFRTGTRRIVIAAYDGKRGHPIIFPHSLLAILDQQARSLKECTEANSDGVTLVEADDTGVLRDVDSPADYDKALKCIARRGDAADKTRESSDRRARGPRGSVSHRRRRR